ncbi:Transcription elongation factor GreB [Methylocella tundrae]|uniref:Transcription elongation factor GreB n=1 Tax=Methylocella tundrae TaxID=227605 RepID=A0A8B6M2G6_METTU|nr:transcription elongation factor GreB [Methylocella tundrae]VTZ49036.1 Transcription elongation factor GreB [Methylocella tundrae]
MLAAAHLAAMSKAFTKEIDDDDDLEDEIAPLPAGLKNYITPEGLARMQAEFAELQKVERPKVVETVSWAAGNGDRSENGDYIYGKRRLREIDRRLRFLRKRMEIAEVVDPARQTNHSRVFFGATVDYLTSQNETKRVRIVGVDEARSELGEVSWISPIAKALLKAEAGDIVEVRTPKGIERVEILKVAY